jgi:glycerol dehydrogenase
MGDALATWFEAESCRLSRSSNVAGGLGSMTAHALARLCYDTLLADGVDARDACSHGNVTPELERVVEANTLLSGLGFESCGLATAHSIHNGLTALSGARSSYHGEKVAFGTLVSLFLTGTSRTMIDEVYGFCRAVGLPTSLADLELGEVTDNDLRRVAEKTCTPGESIHHEPRPVTADDVVAAIRNADRYGLGMTA